MSEPPTLTIREWNAVLSRVVREAFDNALHHGWLAPLAGTIRDGATDEVIFQFILPDFTGRTELGPDCPDKFPSEVCWPVLVELEDSQGKCEGFTLQPQRIM